MSRAAPTHDHDAGFDAPAAPRLQPPMRAVGGAVSFWRELSPLLIASTLVAQRGVLGQFALREFASRHRGSLLGVAWSVLQPLAMLGVYTFVFAVVWGARWSNAGADKPADTLGFAFAVFAALIVWEIFGSAVAAAPTLIVGNANFVKKVVFPLEVLPLAGVLAGVIYALISTAVLLAALLFTGRSVPWTVLLLPLVLVPTVLFAGGIALLVAALGVFLRDIRPIVQGLLLQVLFFLTPIFYPVERIPEWLRSALTLNPMAALVESARRLLVFGQLPEWRSLSIASGASVLVFCLGWAFFRKSKRGFADVL